MASSGNLDLESLLHEMTALIGHQKPNSIMPSFKFNKFQAPLKSTYYNSGDYSPGVATDARHLTGHQGVDLRSAGGTAIYPIAAGIVTGVGKDPKGGNVINIQHPNGVRAYYAHLGSVNVHKGDKVNINTIIGTIGNSGNAKGTFPHLHIQVWQNGQLINPGTLFHVPAYTKVDATKEKVWLSDQAKQQAYNFDMKKHLSSQRTARHKQVELIYKLADAYERLTIRL